jgi:hypothetical protein
MLPHRSCFITRTLRTAPQIKFDRLFFRRLQDLRRSAFWKNHARALEVNPKPECQLARP